MNQMLTWGAVATLIAIVILVVLDRSDEKKICQGKKRPQDEEDLPTKPSPKGATGNRAPAGEVIQMPAAQAVKPLLPPPGEKRIEAVAPRNMGKRR